MSEGLLGEGLVPVIGYGSLASAAGLGPQLAAARVARPVTLAVARRFLKPTQRGGVLAMDLALERATVAVAGLDGARGAGPRCDGLLVGYDPDGGPDLARREGFAPASWRALVAAAGAPSAVPGLLARLAAEAGDEPVAYRRALWAACGANPLQATHYVPHPARTPWGLALVFAHPAPGETGDPAPSARAPYPALAPRHLDALFARGDVDYALFDPVQQRRYVELCLLGAAHGLAVDDLRGAGRLPAGDPTRDLLEGWRRDPSPLVADRVALRASLALEGAPADLDAALARSGLWGLLD